VVAGWVGGRIGSAVLSGLFTSAIGIPVGFAGGYIAGVNIATHYTNPTVEDIYSTLPLFDDQMCKVR
jgi:hypothetical protein